MILKVIIRIFILVYFGQEISFSRSEVVAFCTRANGQLERKGSVRNGVLQKGDSIYHGDKISAKEDEFLTFMNIYDRSMVDVYENSVVRVFENKSDMGIDSEMALFGGKVIVKMENNRDLILNAPTAIVTAKGAHFIAEYKDENFFDNNTYSIFTVLTGKMKVENSISGKVIYIDQGETIIATRDGKLLELNTFKNSSRIINHLDINQ